MVWRRIKLFFFFLHVLEQAKVGYLNLDNFLWEIQQNEVDENIDLSDLQKGFACAVYTGDICTYLKEMEVFCFEKINSFVTGQT
jgi:hypothetical protein